MTVLAWKQQSTTVFSLGQARFDQIGQGMADDITESMTAYGQVLRGGVGLFQAAPGVTRAGWARYVAALQIDKAYPGIQGIGFAKLVRGSVDRTMLEEQLREQGHLNYSVNPAEDRPVSTPIEFLEPLDWRNMRALGYDMYSEGNRRAAMERAMATGAISMTEKVTLVQEDATGSNSDVQPGVLIYLPVYDVAAALDTIDERKSAIRGFVYSPFRMGDLIRGALKRGAYLSKGHASLDIYDGPDNRPEFLLFTGGSTSKTDHQPLFSHTMSISIYGKNWNIQTASTPAFEASVSSESPIAILLGGTTLSALLTLLLRSIDRRRHEAESAERHLRSILDGNLSFVGLLHPDGTLAEANSPALLAGGVTRDEVIGRPFWDCVWWSHDANEQERLKAAVNQVQAGEIVRYDAVVRLKGDQRMSIDFLLTPIKDATGAVKWLVPSGVDITARKKSDERQRMLMQELAHRGKNLLAVVQSIAGRTMTRDRTVVEARELFEGRIQALARTYGSLVDEAFAGAPLEEIVTGELETFTSRADVSGPSIFLTARAAQMFALVVHELATNAVKFGALSVPSGRVRVSWDKIGSEVEQQFRFEWKETGGPAVSEPARRGFGTTFITSVIGAELQCKPETVFAAHGFEFRLQSSLAGIGVAHNDTANRHLADDANSRVF